MDELAVPDAAQRMGLSEQRVRALLKAGRIPGRKVGWSWLVDAEAALRVPRPAGRPLASRSAWGLLAILADEDPGWLEPSAISRIRHRLRHQDIVRLLREGEPRSVVENLRVLPADVSKVPDLVRIVPTGLSAPHPGLDIVPVGQKLDAYVSLRARRAIERTLQPLFDPDEPNLVVRVPSHPWILDQLIAPPSVVAADLLDDPDPRVARAARSSIRRLVDACTPGSR